MKAKEKRINESEQFLSECMIRSDHVTFFREHTKIAWACELGLRAKVYRSEVILGSNPTKIIESGNNFITIDFHDWSKFFYISSSLFRGNYPLCKQVGRTVNNELASYEQKVRSAEEYFNLYGMLPSKTIEDLFTCYSRVDSFATFNILIPIQYFVDQLNGIMYDNAPVVPDDFMVSVIEPHRMLVRRKLLNLALESIDNHTLSKSSIDAFLNEIMPYADFDLWLFDDSKIQSEVFLLHEVQRVLKSLSRNDILLEINSMEHCRKAKLIRYCNCLKAVYNNFQKRFGEEAAIQIRESLSFLSLITTEEEWRHMIECRHFVLLGRIIKKLSLDVGRSSTKEIVNAAKMLWDNEDV